MPKRLQGLVKAATLAGLGVCLAGAHAMGSIDDDGVHAHPTLISERDALVPGETALIGLHFDIDDDWHVYWHGQNDSGSPINIGSLTMPAGFEAEPLRWPAPKRYVQSIGGMSLLDYVYEERVTLILPVKVPASAKIGSDVTISCALEWVECHEVCLFQEQTVSLTLPVRREAKVTKEGVRAIKSVVAREGKPVPKVNAPVRLRFIGDTLEVRADRAESMSFYPDEKSALLTDPLKDGEAKGNVLRIGIDEPSKPVIGLLEVVRTKGSAPLIYSVHVKARESGDQDD